MKTVKIVFQNCALLSSVPAVVFWFSVFAISRCEANPTQYFFIDPNYFPLVVQGALFVDPADQPLGVLPGSYIDIPGAGGARFNIPTGEQFIFGLNGDPVVLSGQIFSVSPVYFAPGSSIPQYDALSLSLDTINDDQLWIDVPPANEPKVPGLLSSDGYWLPTTPVGSVPDTTETICVLSFSLTTLGMARLRLNARSV